MNDRTVRWKVYRDKAGRYRWTFYDEDLKTILYKSSESYVSKSNLKRILKRILGGYCKIVCAFNKHGDHYRVIKALNGMVLGSHTKARSQPTEIDREMMGEYFFIGPQSIRQIFINNKDNLREKK